MAWFSTYENGGHDMILNKISRYRMILRTGMYSNTHTHNHFMALWILSWTTHSPTDTYCGHQLSLICFLYLLWSMASSLFNLHPWQCLPQFLQVFFDLPLGLVPFTSYSIHFFTQSLSSFHSRCLYHRNLFCCSTEIMSSDASLSLNPLLVTLSCSLMPHIHLTILISACWSATSFFFITG